MKVCGGRSILHPKTCFYKGIEGGWWKMEDGFKETIVMLFSKECDAFLKLSQYF